MVKFLLLLGCNTGVEKAESESNVAGNTDSQAETTTETNTETTTETTTETNTETNTETTTDTEERVEENRLEPIEMLIRLSLDIRGIRPTIEELDRLEGDPQELDVLIDEYLDSLYFGPRIRSLFGQIYNTDSHLHYITNVYLFTDDDDEDIAFIYGEEPLYMLQYVAENDLPWTTIVQADWTVVNETLAKLYPTDYPQGETGWKKAYWTDGRPPVGVIATNGFMNRYISMGVNYNRSRANAVSRLLLCEDYLGRSIEFSRETSIQDEASTLEATQNNTACVGCHVTLDPLSSHFYGFWSSYGYMTQLYYTPSDELNWMNATGVPPSYYGQPSNGLVDLGNFIASDSRFPNCAVKQMMESFYQREITIDDVDRFNLHRETFLNSDMRLKSLIRSIVKDPVYTAGPEDVVGGVNTKMVTADMIRYAIEDITGLNMTLSYSDRDLLNEPEWRVILGGTDGDEVQIPSNNLSMPILLAQSQITEFSSLYLARNEAELDISERRMFTFVDFSETPDSSPEAFASQIQFLYRRVLSKELTLDDPEIQTYIDLWQAVFESEVENSNLTATEHRIHAWAAILAGIMQDPTFMLY